MSSISTYYDGRVVAIEPMTEADIDAILTIDRDANAPHLREELARSWARLRVAREGERTIGYVLFWHVTDEIHLLNIAVDPSERRRGIGRTLVDEVIAYALESRAVKILLEVRASNAAARALYTHAGFTQFNVRERYYNDGEDGVEMVLAL